MIVGYVLGLRRMSNSDLQGGFRADRGTSDQIFLLNEIIGKRLEEKLGTVLLLLDVQKAYDRVWRHGLFYKLKQAGVGGRCLAMLRQMYQNVTRKILINDSFTDEFQVHASVPQALYSPHCCMPSMLMGYTRS